MGSEPEWEGTSAWSWIPAQVQINGKLCFLQVLRRLARLRFLMEKYRDMPVPVYPPSISMILLKHATEKGSYLKLRGSNLCPPEWNLVSWNGVQIGDWTLGNQRRLGESRLLHEWSEPRDIVWNNKAKGQAMTAAPSVAPPTWRDSITPGSAHHSFRKCLNLASMQRVVSLTNKEAEGKSCFFFSFERVCVLIMVFWKTPDNLLWFIRKTGCQATEDPVPGASGVISGTHHDSPPVRHFLLWPAFCHYDKIPGSEWFIKKFVWPISLEARKPDSMEAVSA